LEADQSYVLNRSVTRGRLRQGFDKAFASCRPQGPGVAPILLFAWGKSTLPDARSIRRGVGK
jgi:hypothetical protein